MLKLDGTENKSKFGANAILGVSLAVCKAGAAKKGIPLYKFVHFFFLHKKEINPFGLSIAHIHIGGMWWFHIYEPPSCSSSFSLDTTLSECIKGVRAVDDIVIRSTLSHCTDSESLSRVGFKPTTGQETHLYQLCYVGVEARSDWIASKPHFPVLLGHEVVTTFSELQTSPYGM